MGMIFKKSTAPTQYELRVLSLTVSLFFSFFLFFFLLFIGFYFQLKVIRCRISTQGQRVGPEIEMCRYRLIWTRDPKETTTLSFLKQFENIAVSYDNCCGIT